jgi:hypothetical protein
MFEGCTAALPRYLYKKSDGPEVIDIPPERAIVLGESWGYLQ